MHPAIGFGIRWHLMVHHSHIMIHRGPVHRCHVMAGSITHRLTWHSQSRYRLAGKDQQHQRNEPCFEAIEIHARISNRVRECDIASTE